MTYNVPIFLINLDKSTEKMEFMKKQLTRLKLNYERISAVCGADLSAADIDAVYSSILNKTRYHRNLTVGEIGCYMSHRHAWKRICDNNIEFAIVLEDDVNIEKNFVSIFEHVEALKSFDLIKLADNRNIAPANIRALSSTAEIVSYSRIPNCATGYAISLSGAMKMLSRKKIFRPVDIDFQFCYELNLSVIGYRSYPITENDSFASDIVASNKGKHSNRSGPWRNLKFRFKVWRNRKFYQSAQLD